MNMLKVKKSITLLVGMMTITAFSGIAQAETRFAVQDPTGTTDKMVVTDTGKIGINVSNPIYQFQMVGSGDPSTAAALITSPGRAVGYLPSDSGGFSFMRNNDVSINSGLPKANDRLGYFGFGSYIGTGYKWLSVIQSYTEADATATSAPTYFSIGTTNVNSLGATEKVRITSAGNVGIGITSPTQKLEVYNGGLRLNNLQTTAKPACSSNTRGTLWYTTAAVGVADTLQICVKDAANNYLWKDLF